MLQLIMGIMIGTYFAEDFRGVVPILDPKQKEDVSNEVSNMA